MTAFGLGALAGLAVAMPVGPVAVLLLQEALVRGRRTAVAAAAGIATVDLLYAVAAVLVGAQLAATLGRHERAVHVVAAVVLAVVGLWGLAAWWRTRTQPPVPALLGAQRTTYLRFVALTLVNPLTALVFATVAVGAVARLESPGGWAAVAFVVGAGLASLAWQLVLALGGSAAGSRLGERARAWVTPVGSLVVVALAGLVLAG